MSGLFLIVRMAGEIVALPAAEVESVVEIEAVVPVPGTARHILGLSALRSRVVTVIDCAASLGADSPGDDNATRRDAVVAVVEGHPYALLVDGVDDVAASGGGVHELAAQVAPGWRRAARGLVEIEERMLLLADVAALIAGPGAQPGESAFG
jgi:purine-binding chemotaxis protein CheW